MNGDGKGGGKRPELVVEAPFVGFEVLKPLGFQLGHEPTEVGRDGVQVFGVSDGEVHHPVSLPLQVPREIAHRGKDPEDFLGMVQHVVGLLPDLHQNVNRFPGNLGKPGMQRVELVTKEESESFHGSTGEAWIGVSGKALTFHRMRGYLAGLEIHDFQKTCGAGLDSHMDSRRLPEPGPKIFG